MKKIILLIALFITSLSFAQLPPAYYPDGVKGKFIVSDTLSTAQRDALTPDIGTIIYHKDTGISQLENYNGTAWTTFAGGGSQTLQQVTDLGATTDNPLSISNNSTAALTIESTDFSRSLYASFDRLLWNRDGFNFNVRVPTLLGNYSLYYPQLTANDTIATKTDLIGLGGGGDVSKVGTPVNNQIGVWTGDGTIEGDADLTFSANTLNIGINDSSNSILNMYGSGTNTGASFNIYNAGLNDSSAEFYEIKANQNFEVNLNNGVSSSPVLTIDDVTGGIQSPAMSIADINTLGNTSLITKEYADATYSSTGHTIQNNGSGLTDRAELNFVNGLTAEDNAGSGSTDVNLDYTKVLKVADDSPEKDTEFWLGNLAQWYADRPYGTAAPSNYFAIIKDSIPPATTASDIVLDDSAFNGNLTIGDDDLQKLANKVDDLVLGSSFDETADYTLTGVLTIRGATSFDVTPPTFDVGADFSNNKATNLANGTNSGDAVNKGQLDAVSASIPDTDLLTLTNKAQVTITSSTGTNATINVANGTNAGITENNLTDAEKTVLGNTSGTNTGDDPFTSTKISGASANAGLVGTEEVLINNAGTLEKTTTQDIADLGGGGTASPVFKGDWYFGGFANRYYATELPQAEAGSFHFTSPTNLDPYAQGSVIGYGVSETKTITNIKGLAISDFSETYKMYAVSKSWEAITGDFSMTATDATLTTSTFTFDAGDVGKSISVHGAGTAGAHLRTTIASFTNANEVELTAVADTTVASVNGSLETNTLLYTSPDIVLTPFVPITLNYTGLSFDLTAGERLFIVTLRTATDAGISSGFDLSLSFYE